jgi:heat shock protein HslJ
MRSAFRFLLALPLLAVGLLSAGTHAQAQTAGLAGTSWKLVEIQGPTMGVQNTSGQNITINFDSQGHAGGQSTCNVYGGEYAAGADGSLSITNVISTLRACVEGDLQGLETEYFNAISSVKSYAYDGNNLALAYGNGGILTYQPTNVTIGMPQTGYGFADVAPFGILGLSMILLGAGFLVWRRSTDLA